MNKYKYFFSYPFKFWLIILFTLSIGIIFYQSLTDKFNADKVHKISPITETIKNQLSPFYTTVKTGLYIKHFLQFDALKNKFQFSAIVWFEFSPHEMSLDNVKEFSFLDGVITSRSNPDIRLIRGKVFVKYNIIVSLNSNLRFNNYPYDSHRLPITITNQSMPLDTLILVTENNYFNIDKFDIDELINGEEIYDREGNMFLKVKVVKLSKHIPILNPEEIAY